MRPRISTTNSGAARLRCTMYSTLCESSTSDAHQASYNAAPFGDLTRKHDRQSRLDERLSIFLNIIQEYASPRRNPLTNRSLYVMMALIRNMSESHTMATGQKGMALIRALNLELMLAISNRLVE